ncbi:hypothetical protein AGMMS50268_22050 [Spirochaetia bacterium]|nr:hypothetical protein AGMMS50268_22050 [Spirochaetia bacterium]
MDFLKRGHFFIIFFGAALAVITGLSSCTANISGRLEQGGGGEFTVSASLGPRMAALIRSLGAAGGGSGDFVLDGAIIAQSMVAAPGVESVSFRNTGPVALEGPVKIAKIGDFLAPAAGKKGFITFEAPRAGGGRLSINLNREAGPEILSLVSTEIVTYLEALMAPIVTGEVLTKAQYLEALASIYNKAVADEVSGGTIRAAIDFPGPISAVRGGTYTGKKAEFTIPLLDLLVLERPLIYEVTWK